MNENIKFVFSIKILYLILIKYFNISFIMINYLKKIGIILKIIVFQSY